MYLVLGTINKSSEHNQHNHIPLTPYSPMFVVRKSVLPTNKYHQNQNPIHPRHIPTHISQYLRNSVCTMYCTTVLPK